MCNNELMGHFSGVSSHAFTTFRVALLRNRQLRAVDREKAGSKERESWVPEGLPRVVLAIAGDDVRIQVLV